MLTILDNESDDVVKDSPKPHETDNDAENRKLLKKIVEKGFNRIQENGEEYKKLNNYAKNLYPVLVKLLTITV